MDDLFLSALWREISLNFHLPVLSFYYLVSNVFYPPSGAKKLLLDEKARVTQKQPRQVEDNYLN